MERRTFLSLLASAPIAALAPWPAILDRYAVGDVFTIAGTYAVNPPRSIKQWVIGSSRGETWNDMPVRDAVGQWIDDAARSS